MKKGMIGLMVGLFCMVAAAETELTPAEVAFNAAQTLQYVDKDYAKAQVAFEKVLKDFPNAPVALRSGAQIRAVSCMISLQDYEAAKAAAAKGLKDYPDASVDTRAIFAMHAAQCLYQEKKYAEADVAYAAIITDYPSARVGLLSNIQQTIGYCKERSGMPEEALAAWRKVLSDYPSASATVLATAHMNIARNVSRAARVTEYQTVLSKYPNIASSILLQARFYLADALRYSGTAVDANKAYMAVVENHVQEYGAKDDTGMIWKSYNQVNPKLISTAEYKDWLDTILRVTPATEDNAKFLGKVKSAMGKLQ